jgi:hypothetical protein
MMMSWFYYQDPPLLTTQLGGYPLDAIAVDSVSFMCHFDDSFRTQTRNQ